MRRPIRKVLLINPPWYRFFGEQMATFPLGLCYIAGVLKENGYEVVIYNSDLSRGAAGVFSLASGRGRHLPNYLEVQEAEGSPVWKEIEETIAQQAPDIVGITVRTPAYRSARLVSRIVKRLDPSLPVVWGGIHPTVLPEETLRLKEVDVVVRGEGEYTFLEMLQNLDHLERVPGISFKDGQGGIIHNPERPLVHNLDGLPFPAKELMLGWQNMSREAMGNLFATRGCPYNCVFCSSQNMWTRRVRYRSLENVLAEIRHLFSAYGVRRFLFVDDSFTVNWRWTSSLCDALIREKLPIKWWCETRVDLLTEEMASKMKQAGCEEVVLGVESGSEETLRRIKKGITLAQAREAARILHKAGLFFYTGFMIGFPWETKKDIEATLAFMEELRPFNTRLGIATPYPGTELYNLCLAEGLLSPDVDWTTFFAENPGMFFSKQFSPEEASGLASEAQRKVERFNRNQTRALLWRHPRYALRRTIRGGHLRPKRLWDLLRYLLGRGR